MSEMSLFTKGRKAINFLQELMFLGFSVGKYDSCKCGENGMSGAALINISERDSLFFYRNLGFWGYVDDV